MKRFFSLICVFLLISAVVSCGDKKNGEKPAYEEQVTKEISASDGGKVESKDGKTSIEVPADALDENLTITMTIYDAKGYTGTEGQKVVSKVVEFEPSGTVFKKPIIITMAADENVDGKVFSAAVYREEKGEWSYNEHGAYAVLAGRDAAGDPIMQSAAGDPIMLSAAGDPIMQSAAGDPIMMAAAGDPIMLASAGDPIMSNAAGDPIMNAAAGDPIMMTTGHFTAYTFIVLESAAPVEEPDEEVPESDEEITDEDDDIDISDIEISDNDEDEIPDETEDEDEIPVVDEDTVIPEPELVLSKVLCTGQINCSDGSSIIDCPEEGEELYGQDAQFIANKSCVPHKYTKLEPVVSETGGTYEPVTDENTGLTWIIFTEYDIPRSEAQVVCENLELAGFGDWRLPTQKELLSISDHGRSQPSVRESYFKGIGTSYYWTSADLIGGEEDNNWFFEATNATIIIDSLSKGRVACVRGEEYGKVNAESYVPLTIGGDEVVSDSSTNLVWQKDSVKKTWKEALKYCIDLEYAGYSDWRLPNKNELVTLVDYSKADPASSFPGMTSEEFWTSTFETFYGGMQGVFAINMATGRINYNSSGTTLAVRCVRSDIKPLSAGTVPFCDESRAAPCEDPETHYVWSVSEFPYSTYLMWANNALICRMSEEGGITQWRLPAIDELRTLLGASGKLKTGGECKVTNACSDYYDPSCFDEGKCSGGEGAGFESSLGDYEYLVSGTLSGDGYTAESPSWTVDLRTGSIISFAGDYVKSNSRCIKDDSIPNPAFPYTDSETHLIWSSFLKDYVYWNDVGKYCKTLVEGGSNNWRMPTIDELKTLLTNCPEGNCKPDVAGKYSVFGDIYTLWASDIDYEDELGAKFSGIDFMTASEVDSTSQYFRAGVRCVRGTDEPETEPEIEFPFEIGDLIWSKVSEAQVSDADEAREYCNSLNDEGYGGRTDWTLPNSTELLSLVKKSVCSNKNNLFSGNGSCNKISFDGYSIFDDMIMLVGSNCYVDFAQGQVYYTNYPYGYVRCVVVLPDSGS